jgi:DNA-binding CsgD family transcriptional regulator
MSSGAMPIGGGAAMVCVLSVFDALGHGGFLLGHERQVMAHNNVARNVLGSGLTLQGKRLAATDRASDVRLQCVIESALTGSGREQVTSVGVRRHSRLPLLILVLPLDDDALAAPNSARLLMVACDPERSAMPPQPMLAEMFGLTPAEAGVAVGIAAGRQLSEIATDRGIKIETVRWYSKIVFNKTHTRGKAELTALLTKLAVPAPYGRAGA